MGYSILYERFMVDQDDALIPYIIHGQNNVYLPKNGVCGKRRRERIMTNLFTEYPDLDKHDMHDFLTVVHRQMGKDCWMGIPVWRDRFIKMFYRNVFKPFEVISDPVEMGKRVNIRREKQ